MSEIAEELERLAKELQAEAESCEDRRVQDVVASPATEAASVFWEGKQLAYTEAADLLRTRAAELRAQRSGPTLQSLPKPKNVRVSQWWSYEGLPPKCVARTSSLCGKTTQTHVFFELRSDEAEMLADDRWIYLGYGSDPTR